MNVYGVSGVTKEWINQGGRVWNGYFLLMGWVEGGGLFIRANGVNVESVVRIHVCLLFFCSFFSDDDDGPWFFDFLSVRFLMWGMEGVYLWMGGWMDVYVRDSMNEREYEEE